MTNSQAAPLGAAFRRTSISFPVRRFAPQTRAGSLGANPPWRRGGAPTLLPLVSVGAPSILPLRYSSAPW
jgi:hypothetical protein